MMGVYIKGMEMPSSCFECCFYIESYDGAGVYECAVTGTKSCKEMERHFDCPLVPVHTHGGVMSETVEVDAPIYDEEELHYGCVVQVLRNSVTGETSIGWWKEVDDDF